MSNKTCPPCTGDCSQGRLCTALQAEMLARLADTITNPPRKVVPLSPEEYAELTQRPMRWNGLTVAAAIVCACAVIGLLVHAAGVHGWLR